MTRTLLVAALVGATATSALGCTITLPGADGGAAGPDAGDDAAPTTVGDQCTRVFTELCGQAINRCALTAFSADQCIAANMPSCCTGSTCTEKAKAPSSAVTSCTQAIDAEDCNAIVNNEAPSACQTVVHNPS